MIKSASLTSIKIIVMALALAAGFLMINPASAATLVKPENLVAGDLIRGESYSAVYYYGTDGFRYVFPNSKTYFTWYDNFDTVKWLSDSDLSSVQIGGNVTYKPGVKMIKINSDPKVYAVGAGGSLHHMTTEAIAIALYGSDWNKQIDDVPDGFFPNYKIGSALDTAGSFSVTAEKADAKNINTDKKLKAATQISITSTGFSPASVTISVGTAVRFVNNDTVKHTASGDDKTWGTGTMNAGKNFSKYFKQAGTYTYTDSYGTGNGTIIVQ